MNNTYSMILTNMNWQNRDNLLFCGIYDGNAFIRAKVFANDTGSGCSAGNIYIGRVRDIVKNIDCAFVEIMPGVVGYYSLSENHTHNFLNKKNSPNVCQGDLLLVQIKKEAVKSKACVLSSKISLNGAYSVLNYHDSGIHLSSKLNNERKREELINQYSSICSDCSIDLEQYGIVVRTNAPLASNAEIESELRSLHSRLKSITSRAIYQRAFTLMEKPEPPYLSMVQSFHDGCIAEIITDSSDIQNELNHYFNDDSEIYLRPFHSVNIRFYEDDSFPLYKMYGLESFIKKVSSRQVWLKSGAYLVIDPTEAMVVIDVNTGKNIKGKEKDSSVLKVNLEAADEIARQLILRNISGIIVIDFINMKSKEYQKQLCDYMVRLLKSDPVPANFVEMNSLNLMFITRKKTSPPIYEMLHTNVK